MTQYNLNKRQRQIVQVLVAAYEQGHEDEFWWLPTMGAEPVIEIDDDEIRADETDLVALEAEEVITLRSLESGAGYAGSLRQRAFEAVANDFSLPEGPAASSTVNIGNYVQTMTGGNVQGAAGSQITQQLTANDPEALLELFRDVTDQLTTALTDLLTPQHLRSALRDVQAVQEAAESGDSDPRMVAGHIRSVGQVVLNALDVGDKLGGTLQALLVLGPWAHMAFQIIQAAFP